MEKSAKKSIAAPSKILQDKFLTPLGITAYRLAKDAQMSITTTAELLKGRRRITTDTALRLSKYFGNAALFWLTLQNEYDIETERAALQKDLDKIKPIKKPKNRKAKGTTHKRKAAEMRKKK